MTNARKNRQATAEKAARLRAEQAAREGRRRMALIAGLVAIVLVVAGGITVVVLNARASGVQDDVALAGVQTFEGITAEHVTTTVDYEQTPPVGGDHNPVWLNCGIYDEPVQNENAVHALEHGAVWITYAQDLPDTEVETLKDLVAGQTYLVLSPYPQLPDPITLSAWGVQLSVQSADDPRIAQFVKEYKQGPQTPEPGAACTGGTGTPQG